MGTTRPAKETMIQRAKASPSFRAALMGEALELIAENDVQTAKSILRDCVEASIGFEALAKELGKEPESIMQMLSPEGNPTMKSMAALLASLKQHEGVTIHVKATL